MTQLKPYDGPILPLDSAPTQGGLKPYEGELLPLEEGVDPSQRDYQTREFGPQGQVPVANKPVYEPNTPFVERFTDFAGRALNPVGTALGAAIEAGEDYFGVDVPNPFSYNPGKSVVGGLMNVPKELATTVVAAGEELDQFVDPENTGTKIIPRGSAAWLDQNMPEYHPQSTADAIVTEVTQAGVGAAGGAKAVAQAGIKTLPKFFKWAAAGLGAEGAAAATVDQDTQGLFVGEDPQIAKLWGGMAIDPNGRYSENLLKKRMNILTEAYLVSKTGEKAVKMGIGAGKFINDVILNPGKTFFQKGSKEEAIVRDMADTLIGARDDLTNEQQFDLRMDLANKIDQFSSLKVEGVSEVATPTGQKLPDVNIKRDTMSAYTRSLDAENAVGQARKENMLQKAKADMMRSGQKGKAAADLEIATGQGATQLEELTQQTEKAFGGKQAQELGKEHLQEEGHRIVDEAKDTVTRVETKLEDSKKGAESLIEGDENFSKIPREGGTKLDLEATSRSKADEAVSEVAEEGEHRTRQSKLLHEAIPEDAHANIPALNEALDLPDDEGITIAEALDDDLRAKLGKAGDNFKKLNKFANFELRSAIDKGVKDGDWGRVAQLRRLKKHINEEQLDYLTVSGDQQTREAAEKARDYYKQEVAPSFRQGPGQKIQKLSRDKAHMKPDEFKTESRAVLKGTIENPDAAEHTNRIYEVLQSRGKEDLLVDYAFADAASEAQRLLNQGKGKIDPTDIAKIGSKLEKFGPLLTKSGKGKRFDDFMSKLNDKNISTEELTKDLAEVQKMAGEVERQIYGEQMKEFFESSGTGYVGKKTDGYEIFADIMNNQPDKIDGIVKALEKSNDPLTKSAGKSAYGKWAADKLFESGRDPGDVPKLNLNTMKKDRDKILSIGKKFFGDDSPIMIAQEKLMDEADVMARSQTQRALTLHDLRDSEKGMRDSVATVITFAFGTLDRLGARVRAASGRAITNMSKSQQAREIMSAMYANPDEFTAVLRRVAEKDRNKLTKETKDTLYGMFSKGLTFADYGAGNKNRNENTRVKNMDLERTSKRDAK